MNYLEGDFHMLFSFSFLPLLKLIKFIKICLNGREGKGVGYPIPCHRRCRKGID
jgi:hypothetical protein